MTEPTQLGGGGVVISSAVVAEEVDADDVVGVLDVEERVGIEELGEEEAVLVVKDEVDVVVSLSPKFLFSYLPLQC